MDYFRQFPTIDYAFDRSKTLYTLTDLTVRFRVRDLILDDSVAWYSYTLTDEDRPDVVSHKYYGSPLYVWLLFFANDIFDPLYDWPLGYNAFHSYLAHKYRPIGDTREDYEIISAIQDLTFSSGFQAHHYETPSGYWVDATTFISTGGFAVSIYDYELSLNEAKRNIKIVDKYYFGQIVREFREIFR